MKPDFDRSICTPKSLCDTHLSSYITSCATLINCIKAHRAPLACVTVVQHTVNKSLSTMNPGESIYFLDVWEVYPFVVQHHCAWHGGRTAPAEGWQMNPKQLTFAVLYEAPLIKFGRSHYKSFTPEETPPFNSWKLTFLWKLVLVKNPDFLRGSSILKDTRA